MALHKGCEVTLTEASQGLGPAGMLRATGPSAPGFRVWGLV